MKQQKNSGMVLAMVLMCLSIMTVLIYGLSQMTASQQRSASNYVDMKIAENYAKAALFDAESHAYIFDLDNQLESPLISCGDAVKALGGTPSDYLGANCLSLRRGWKLQNLNDGSNILTNGATCNNGGSNKGICFNNNLSLTAGVNDIVFDSDMAWHPWAESGGVAPCKTYSRDIPLWIDDKDSNYSISYPINDKNVCAMPRYMIEPINLDFRGTHVTAPPIMNVTYESDVLVQKNNAKFTLYKMSESRSLAYNEGGVEASIPLIPSARLYRLTVVAFGHNGNTRVMVQEIIAVSNFTPDAFEKRESKDTEDNFAYRIQRISTTWIR